MSTTRRERQLGLITPDIQRYSPERAGDALDAISKQICPFCGCGPFSVVAIHVNQIHGINHRELRAMFGLRMHDKICDPYISKMRSSIANTLIANGDINPHNARSHRQVIDAPKTKFGQVIGPGPWCGTAGGYSNHQCRCKSCTDAWAVAHLKYMHANAAACPVKGCRKRPVRMEQHLADEHPDVAANRPGAAT